MTTNIDILNAIEALTPYRKRWFVEYISKGFSTINYEGNITHPLDFDAPIEDIEKAFLLAQNASIDELCKVYKPRRKCNGWYL